MEVLKQEFQQRLPQIEEAILGADFVSVDAEFTGLFPPGDRYLLDDDVNERYQRLRSSVKAFSVIQFGVCAFKRASEDGHYTAWPFNFYIFGGDDGRAFLSSASSLQFLREHKFDFNKWIDGGIPYYNYSEDPALLSSGVPYIPEHSLTSGQRKYLENVRKQISTWLQKGNTTKPLVLQINSDYQRNLIRYELKKSQYNGFLKAKSRDSKHIAVSKMTAEERLREIYAARITGNNSLNFRRVIEIIQDADCPVVLHNGYLDICHTLDQFWRHLPDDVLAFKSLVKEMWPNIVDTKYLAETHPLLKKSFMSTALAPLFNTVNDALTEAGVKISMAPGFDRYLKDEESHHEAGYDAYMTGVIYLGFVKYITEAEGHGEHMPDRLVFKKPIEEEQNNIKKEVITNPYKRESLVSYYNRLYVMRSIIPYVDLNGDEKVKEVPETYLNRFYLTNAPNGLTDAAIEALYPELTPFAVHWANSSSAWLMVKHERRIERDRTGVLGLDAVKCFLTGGEREQEGKALGITSEAAQMELFSYEQWRTASQFQPSNSSAHLKPSVANEPVDTESQNAQSDTITTTTTSGGYSDIEYQRTSSITSTTDGAQVKLQPKGTESASVTAQLHQEGPDIPTGGSAYDEFDIPMPSSFLRGKKREAPTEEKEEEEGLPKWRNKRQNKRKQC